MLNPSRSSGSVELENRNVDSDTTLLLQPPQGEHGAWSTSTTPRVSDDYEHRASEQGTAPRLFLNLGAPTTEDNENAQLLSAPDSSIPIPEPARTPSEVYQAFPLLKGRRQIRVLDIENTVSNYFGPQPTITGTLRVIDMDENPIFTALSYTWGEYAEPKDEIVLWNNGCRFAVTKNCLSALIHLRKILGSFTIWIDAICINQDDDAEKSHQIGLMADIYTAAHFVYYWIGEGNKNTDRAMAYLRKGALPFSTGITNYVPQALRLGLLIPTGRSLSIRLGISLFIRLLSGRIRPHYDGLDDIFSRPWIQRMWTLQEAVLPRRGVIVCGYSTIPWLSMFYSLKFMEHLHKRALTLSFPDSTREWRRLSSTWARHLTDMNNSTPPNLDPDTKYTPPNCEAYYSSSSPRSAAEREAEDKEHKYLNKKQLRKELDRHSQALYKGWRLFRALLMIHCLIIALGFIFFLVAIPAAILTGVGAIPAPSPTFNHTVSYTGVTAGFLCLVLAVPLLVLRQTSRKDRYRIYPFTTSETLAIELQSRLAGSARDKYFAILSFLDRPRVLPLDTPIETVYRILFGRVVAHSDSLDVLLFTGLTTTTGKMGRGGRRLFLDPETPTWVVDWRVASPVWLHLRYFLSDRTLVRFAGKKIRGRNGIPGRAGVFRYRGAALGPMVRCKFRGGREMHVFGNLISKLTWCSGRMGDGELGDRRVPSLDELLPSVEKFMTAIKGFKHYWKAFDDLTHHAMEETMGGGGRVPVNGRYYWGQMLGEAKVEKPENGSSREAAEKLLKQARTWASSKSWFNTGVNNTRAWRVHRAITNFLANEGMGLVRCESENLTDFGWAPEGARQGDTVALISGVSLPMILRKREGTKYHEIVGPCFFYLVMEGQVWEKPELEIMENIILV